MLRDWDCSSRMQFSYNFNVINLSLVRVLLLAKLASGLFYKYMKVNIIISQPILSYTIWIRYSIQLVHILGCTYNTARDFWGEEASDSVLTPTSQQNKRIKTNTKLYKYYIFNYGWTTKRTLHTLNSIAKQDDDNAFDNQHIQ